jgi:NAD(P)-dependent dehydrogenase (short-subunit alcohol dehydrogenase family)
MLLASDPDGIGFHVALQLALKGAKVYVGARTLQKAEFSISEMKERTVLGNLKVFPLVMNLESPDEVKAAASKIMRAESRLDMLVNNAAR